MDTDWYAVDAEGHVALFDCGEDGAVPEGACTTEELPCTDLVAAARLREQRSTPVVLPRRQTPEQRRVTCPECGRPMRAHIYAGPGNVVIDTCERCGFNWLDGGELRRIAAAPDTLRRRTEEPDRDVAADAPDEDE